MPSTYSFVLQIWYTKERYFTEWYEFPQVGSFKELITGIKNVASITLKNWTQITAYEDTNNFFITILPKEKGV